MMQRAQQEEQIRDSKCHCWSQPAQIMLVSDRSLAGNGSSNPPMDLGSGHNTAANSKILTRNERQHYSPLL